jgi:hypothetical protein
VILTRVFIVQDCFNYHGFLGFHVKFKISFQFSIKNCIGILMNYNKMVFGEMAIFSILIMPIYEHEKSFHLLESPSVSLFSILNVHCMSLTLS